MLIWLGLHFVLVDCFSKMVHFIWCKVTFDATKVVDLLFGEIVWYHGLPSSITFDKDTRFMSILWKHLWTRIGTSLKFSNPYHPLTHGQTEVVNRTLDNMLWTEVKNFGCWDANLPKIEFEFNCSKNQVFHL